MRGRERERGGGSRAHLGHPRRQSWSADRVDGGDRDFGRVPHMGWDGGDWTEVRRRRQKEHRHVNTGIDSMRQNGRYRRDITPISNQFAPSDGRTRFNPFHRDRQPFGQVQSRYSDADTWSQYYRDNEYSRSAYSRSCDSRQQFLGGR
jgi:hypothetical protein